MDDIDMVTAMAMVGFDDLDQVLAMSPGNLATSSGPPEAAGGGGGGGSEEVVAAAAPDLRKGPWTVDEDILLVNYIAAHGEGRWNSLARSAGLKRTGKSCRLRWLNYLRPDLRRGNITAEEQLLILDLHSRWGNRWSKIAHHLPGRTDNEVKNYWRTCVEKHARHLRCDVNSATFRHVVQQVLMPHLLERAQADRRDLPQPVVAPAPAATITASAPPACYNYYDHHLLQQQGVHHHQYYSEEQIAAAAMASTNTNTLTADNVSHYTAAYYTHTSATTETTTNDCRPTTTDDDVFAGTTWSELLATTSGPDVDSSSMSMIGRLPPDFGFGDFEDGLWSLDDLCLQQLS